jgi:putative transposase
MQVSTSAFYAWAKTPEDTNKKILQKQLEAKTIELFEDNKKVYGSRRLAGELHKAGFKVGRYKVRTLMKLWD